jgi:NAD(P)-dependent dehydrogenase (short-subunit alcohol dehydrogenase family)
MKKISLIIGGTRGIGKQINKTLLKRGDKVIVISRKKKNSISADITSNENLSVIKKKIKNKINNLIFCQRLRELNSNKFHDYNLMISSSYELIKILEKKFSKNSSVVFLSSISTTTAVHDQNYNYHAVRGAIEALVKFLAVNLGKNKIRVNCIQTTKILKFENKKFFQSLGKKEKKLIEKITPLRRMGTAEDVANLVDFLTSSKSEFLTGCIIPVDGGLRLVSQETIAKNVL